MQTSNELQTPHPEPSANPPQRGRAWRIVAIVLILHVALLGSWVVLIQGCSKNGSTKTAEISPSTDLPEPSTASKEEPTIQLSSGTNPATPSPTSDVLTPEERLPGAELTEAKPPPQISPPAVNPQPPKIEGNHPLKATPPEAPQKINGAVKYAVKKGDSLTKIAQKYHVSLQELSTANKLTLKSRLKVGQKLTIPNAKTPQIAKASNGEKEVASNKAGFTKATVSPHQIHQVKSGETPISIAKHYGVPVQTLLRVNNIHDPRKIRVNQKLVIPLPNAIHATTASIPGVSPATQEEVKTHSTVTEEPVTMGKEVKGV